MRSIGRDTCGQTRTNHWFLNCGSIQRESNLRDFERERWKLLVGEGHRTHFKSAWMHVVPILCGLLGMCWWGMV